MLGQNCDCTKLFEETFTKIKSAYAGYEEKENALIKKKAVELLKNNSKTNIEYDCAKMIFEYVALFNERHMLFSYAVSIDFKNKNLKDLNKSDVLYGNWTSRDRSFSIKFSRTKQKGYVGTVINSSNPSFHVGQTVIEVFQKNNKQLVAYSEDGMTYFSTLKIEKSSITIDLIEKFTKNSSSSKGNIISTKTSLEIQNDSIAILRLPRFSQKSAKRIKLLSDSIYSNNSLKYLVLDVRSNPGGDPDVFYSLRKLYYTKPITFPDISFKVSKEMRQLDSLNENPLFDEYKHLKNNEFYTVKIDTFVLDDVPKQFKKIFLITDRFTGSSAEVFVKELLQSENVVVDYFRATPFQLQNKKFTIQIPLGKLNWDSKIDDTGIKPSIDLAEVEIEWIEFVIKNFIPK